MAVVPGYWLADCEDSHEAFRHPPATGVSARSAARFWCRRPASGWAAYACSEMARPCAPQHDGDLRRGLRTGRTGVRGPLLARNGRRRCAPAAFARRLHWRSIAFGVIPTACRQRSAPIRSKPEPRGCYRRHSGTGLAGRACAKTCARSERRRSNTAPGSFSTREPRRQAHAAGPRAIFMYGNYGLIPSGGSEMRPGPEDRKIGERIGLIREAFAAARDASKPAGEVKAAAMMPSIEQFDQFSQFSQFDLFDQFALA
jgi:hypothetical protein